MIYPWISQKLYDHGYTYEPEISYLRQIWFLLISSWGYVFGDYAVNQHVARGAIARERRDTSSSTTSRGQLWRNRRLEVADWCQVTSQLHKVECTRQNNKNIFSTQVNKTVAVSNWVFCLKRSARDFLAGLNRNFSANFKIFIAKNCWGIFEQTVYSYRDRNIVLIEKSRVQVSQNAHPIFVSGPKRTKSVAFFSNAGKLAVDQIVFRLSIDLPWFFFGRYLRSSFKVV